MRPIRPREILVAVEPGVLGQALVELLCHTGVDDVVTVARNPGSVCPGSRFDAAVVTGRLPDDVVAQVTIRLPDAEGSAGWGRIVEDGRVTSRVMATPLDVVAALDCYCPATTRRADGLTEALRQTAEQPTNLLTGSATEGES